MMQIQRRQAKDVLILEPTGSLVAAGSMALEIALNDALSLGTYKIIVDLSAVSYIDSTCIGALAHACTKSKKSDGFVRLASVPQNVMKILQLGGLLNYLGHFSSVDDALEGKQTPA